MRELIGDVRYAARKLTKAPGFALVCVLTIAIGMGAVTCLYSVVDGVLLKPYPYKDPGRLVRVFLGSRGGQSEWGAPTWCLLRWREQCTAFESVAVLATVRGFNLSTGDESPERIYGARVTGNFFSTFGVGVTVGRTLLPEESAESAARVVVLGHGFWKRRFGGDPGIVGQMLVLDNVPRLVVGVLDDVPLPRQWAGSMEFQEPEIWVPFNEPDFLRQDPESVWKDDWQVYARLKPGFTPEHAMAQMAPITEEMRKAMDGTDHLHRYRTREEGWPEGYAVPVLEYTTQEFTSYLWLMFATALTVLLIASANVANLFIARSMTTHRETTIRAALGAPPLRLMRLVFMETILVSLAGGGLGALVAWASIPAMVSILPSHLPRRDEVVMDLRVLLATFAIAAATGLVCGIAPSLRLRKTDLQSVLKEGGRSASAGRAHNALRNGLVASEIAIALLVLFCAVLFSARLFHGMTNETGFEPERVLTMQVELRDARGNEDIDAFIVDVDAEMQAAPGIESAAFALNLPFAGSNGIHYRLPGMHGAGEDPGDDSRTARFNTISPGYFHTLGIPLIAGRYFESTDTPASEPVAIVDERFVRYWFKEGNALGAAVELDGALLAHTYRIVGVVGHAKIWPYDDEESDESSFQIYIPLHFAPNRQLYLAARTAADNPFAALPSVKAAIAEHYPRQPVYAVRSMEQIRSRAMTGVRGTAIPTIAFALVGVALAALGCYSVMAYRVAQRRHEIGTRMAVGATPRHIITLVMKQAYLVLAVGGALGIALIVSTVAVPEYTDHEISLFAPENPMSWALLGVSIAALTAVISLSAFVSARKAARIDPVIALREE